MKRQSNLKSVIYIILAAVMWGVIGVFTVTLRNLGVSAVGLSLARALVTVVVMFFVLLIKDKSLFKIRIKDLWIFIGTGVVSFTFFNICYMLCITRCSMSVAAALLYTSPVFVMVFSAILFKEKLTFFKLLAIVVTIIGCGSVSGLFSAEAMFSPMGIALGIMSGFGYGLYTIFGRYGIEKYDTLTVNFYTFLTATLTNLPIAYFMGDLSLNLLDANVFLILILAGVVTCVLPYFFYTKGLESVQGGTAAIFATFEPAVATLMSIIVYHEQMTPAKVVGIILILSAVGVAALDNFKKTN